MNLCQTLQKQRIKFLILLCVIFGLIVSPLSAAGFKEKTSNNSGLDPGQLSKLRARMRSFVDQGSIAGAVTLIARNGRVASLDAFGYHDLESKKPMRTDSIFDIRSVTKPITAIGIMILMEDGKLSLGDPVEKYLPGFGGPKTLPSQTPITIHQLLTHTSGLPSGRPPEIEDITITRNKTLSEAVAFLSRQAPEFEPGTKFRYYSGGYAVLGRIIEIISGKPYEQFIDERIFRPLGMTDSFFFIPTDKHKRVPSIYRVQDGKLSRWNELEANSKIAKYSAPEFGMYSTASDLYALCQMMLNGGTFRGKRILSRKSVELMIQNHTLKIRSATTERPAHQGLGWSLFGDPMDDFPLTSPGSFGHNGAFGAIIWIDPKDELVRIFLEHRFGFFNESNIFMAMAGAAVTN